MSGRYEREGGGSQEDLLGAHGGDYHGGVGQGGGEGEHDHDINLKTGKKRQHSGTFKSKISNTTKNKVQSLVDTYEGWEK